MMGRYYDNVTKNWCGVTGFSVADILEIMQEWGANPHDCSVEPMHVGNGIYGVSLIEYGRVFKDER